MLIIHQTRVIDIRYRISRHASTWYTAVARYFDWVSPRYLSTQEKCHTRQKVVWEQKQLPPMTLVLDRIHNQVSAVNAAAADEREKNVKPPAMPSQVMLQTNQVQYPQKQGKNMHTYKQNTRKIKERNYDQKPI